MGYIKLIMLGTIIIAFSCNTSIRWEIKPVPAIFT